MTDTGQDYEVCLSFAGEDRAYVERVAAALGRAQVRVFYDAYEKVELWGTSTWMRSTGNAHDTV